jgi:glycosyltransferase involved in cell wall biosynthesis
MKLRIVCRSYGGENTKNRPAYYSKLLALHSLLRAAAAADAEIVFLNDGPVPADRLDLMREAGEIHTLPGVGMRRSYTTALRLPSERGWPDEDLVWFSEDDYLYTPDAFVRLLAAAGQLPADYFALYAGTDDMPVAPGIEEMPTPKGWDPGAPLDVDGQRWQRTMSTASTFGARVGALRTDLPIFLQALLPHRNMLRDHDTCVVYQGYEPHHWSRLGRDAIGRSGGSARDRLREAVLVPFKAALNLRSHRLPAHRRTLLAAVPNLATHLEVEQLSPGRDWEQVAEDTRRWLGGRGEGAAITNGTAGQKFPTGPRILVVETSLRDNGGLRVSLENARRWQASGAPTAVAVLQDVDDGRSAVPDPSVPVRFMSRRGHRFRTAWPAALTRLVRAARRSDVVLCGSEIGFGLLLGYAAARIARRPFAVLVQADLDEAIETWVSGPLRRPTRWVHARIDAAVCVSDSVVSGVVANGLPAERTHVVVNGIDVARVRGLAGLGPVPDVVDPGLEPDDPQDARRVPVVANGRLSPQKDFELLIRAHAQILRSGVEHRLLIMGEGPSRPRLEALVAELDLAGSVELPGHVDNPYLHISTAGLFVLSSRSEGMPLTLLEALAVGVPIVATRCGTGTETLLADGEYGELVPVGSVDALAGAIEKHLRDTDELRKRAARGPHRASAFDVGRSARSTLAVMAGLVR